MSNEFFLQCFFDTPGLMLKKSGFPYKDIKARIESAWRSIDLYDVLIVIFDAHRHLTKLVFLLASTPKVHIYAITICSSHDIMYATLLSVITSNI